MKESNSDFTVKELLDDTEIIILARIEPLFVRNQ